MDPTTLLDLIDQFYRRPFTFARAQELFGPVAEDKEDRVLLNPPADSNVTAVTLEKLQVEPDQPPFLAGISIMFKDPPLVDFAELAQRFGPEVELARLKPWQDIPYRFLVQGADYSGYLLCLVPADPNAQGPRWKVNNLILRRFPQGQN
ncbi:MAG: hypothetical protein L0Z62_44595 [Gemmataceae bacterium]|nr:hypothetical protein [Gemmataceae bacterium]